MGSFAWIMAVCFIVISYLIMSGSPEWKEESWEDAVQQFMVNLEFNWRKIVVMIFILNVVAFILVLNHFRH